MPTVPDIHRRGTRAEQATLAAPPLTVGTLYFVTDEGVTERWDGSAWETYSGGAGELGFYQLTGDVTAGPGVGTQAATIAAGVVTYAKLQDVSAASKLLGRGSAAGAGDVEELTLGTNLTLAGTTLNATGGGGAPDPHHASHETGGSDAIKLDDLASPDDTADLNASASAHGLLRKLSGTATEYLNGAGAWSTPAGGGGGGLVLLEQHTAVSAATLDFTTAISATYDEYQIELVGLEAPTGVGVVDLYFRVSTDGGATYAAANYAGNLFQVTTGFSAALGAGTGNSGLAAIKLVHSTQGGHFFRVNGTLKFFSPAAARYKALMIDTSVYSSDASIYRYVGVGQYLTTAAVNAFRLLFSAGTIVSGTVRVYGLAK